MPQVSNFEANRSQVAPREHQFFRDQAIRRLRWGLLDRERQKTAMRNRVNSGLRTRFYAGGMKRIGIVAMIGSLAASAAVSEPVRVNQQICDRLIAHDALPGTAYQPGVDAYGRPVVPADVSGPVVLPPIVMMDLSAPWPPAGEGAGPAPGRRGPLRADAYLGQLSVAPDGSLRLDGRPLGDPEQDYIAGLCRAAGNR